MQLLLRVLSAKNIFLCGVFNIEKYTKQILLHTYESIVKTQRLTFCVTIVFSTLILSLSGRYFSGVFKHQIIKGIVFKNYFLEP